MGVWRVNNKQGSYTPEEADRAFCRGCIYAAGETGIWDYLCNYFLITGKRRGCHAGVGCQKRKEKT